MPLAPGTRLGPFEILASIGAGGMGEVYRARDSTLGREVAIKVLPDALSRDPDRLARFQREAKVLASLNHPNIGQIYGVESQALVMELVDGAMLKGPLPVETALSYARQIAEALEWAHEKGIVHRDLKPANIMVTPAGVVKVLDFGLAKAAAEQFSADPAEAPTVTQAPTRMGAVLGTPAYMSPEQARGETADRRADIWAFGAVLYELLAGKLASSRTSDQDWTALPGATPPRIRNLLRRCLERDLKLRLQAIGEARIAINAPEQDVGPRVASRWPWAAAALAMAFALMLAAGWWRASRPAPLRPLMSLSVELGPETKVVRPLGGSLLALSPDGTLLAVIIRGADGEARLGTRRLDQSEITPLAGTEDAASPFFSPDGQWIAFFSRRKLKKISVRGGPAVTLCDVAGRITGSWGDDGNIITPLGWGTGLSRIPAAGGTPVQMTKLNRGEFRHGWPQVLPGSHAVLFTNERSADEADIEVVSWKTGNRTTLVRGGFFGRYLPSGHLVWVRQNALYAAPFDLEALALTGAPQPVVEAIYNADDEGADLDFSQTGNLIYGSAKGAMQRSIFWMDASGKTQPLSPAPGLYGFPRFSPDGKRMAYSLGDGNGQEDVWVHDLESGLARRVTLMPGQNQRPLWTGDSRNLVISASNPAAPGIYWIQADGSGVPQRLTDGKTWLGPQSISPDDKRLAVVQASPNGGVEIWTAPLESGDGHPRLGKLEPFLQTPFVTVDAAFSPDGRWLAYRATEPGKQGLWVAPFPGPGGGWLVSSRGGEPMWSRNGHDLFFLEDARTIMVAAYTVKGDALVFGKPQVWSSRRLLDMGSPPVNTIALAPDGKRFAVVLNTDGTADPKPVTHLTFLLNFFDELRRRVPSP